MFFMANRKGSSDMEYIKLVCEHCGKEIDVPKEVSVYCCNTKMQVKDKYTVSIKAKI